MNEISRVQNSYRNLLGAFLGQALFSLFQFISQTALIYTMGKSYTGVNGIFANILTLLSLTDLGMSVAIIYSMYGPIAKKDYPAICALMRFYRGAYTLIGVATTVIGFSLMPFLPRLIDTSKASGVQNLNVVYALFVLSVSATYFFSYKRSILIADQKNRVVALAHYGIYAAMNACQAVVLLLTHNYLLYLIPLTVFALLENAYITRRANRDYPFLKGMGEHRLGKEERKSIFKNIGATFFLKMENVVIGGTDILVITAFFTETMAANYMPYLTVVNAVHAAMAQLFTALQASVGNLHAAGEAERGRHIFRTLLLMSFWLGGIAAIVMVNCFQPLIMLWTGGAKGGNYLLADAAMWAVVSNFFAITIRRPGIVYSESTGLFWKLRYKPIIGAALNLGLSIALAHFIGVAGVFVGTLVSMALIDFPVEGWAVCRAVLEMKLRHYFARCGIYLAGVVGVGGICTLLCALLLPGYGLGALLGRAAICLTLSNGLFLLLARKTPEFRELACVAKGIARRLRRRKA